MSAFMYIRKLAFWLIIINTGIKKFILRLSNHSSIIHQISLWSQFSYPNPILNFNLVSQHLVFEKKGEKYLVFEKKGEDNWELDYHQIPVIKLNGVTNSSKSLNGRFCSALFCHSTRTDPSNACRGERVEGSRHQGWAPDRVQQPYTSPERRRQTGLRLRSDLLTFCRRRDP